MKLFGGFGSILTHVPFPCLQLVEVFCFRKSKNAVHLRPSRESFSWSRFVVCGSQRHRLSTYLVLTPLNKSLLASMIPQHRTLAESPLQWLHHVTLWWTNIAMERSTIFNGKINYFYGHFQLPCLFTRGYIMLHLNLKPTPASSCSSIRFSWSTKGQELPQQSSRRRRQVSARPKAN